MRRATLPRTIATVSAVIVTTMGGTSLAGWLFGIDRFKSIIGTITMKANMAIALISCGIALFLMRGGSSRRQNIATALATLAAGIGALTLSEHLVGWDLGIDQLLFAEAPGAEATTVPG